MKRTKAAIQASRLVRELKEMFKDLSRFCHEAHEVSLNDETVRLKLYDKQGKDGVRAIEGVLERCEAAVSILNRRGVSAETRLAALWFVFFRNEAWRIGSDFVVKLCADRLESANSEYRVAELPKLLGAEKSKPLVILWQQYTSLCTVVAAHAGLVLDYQQAIRFWLLYAATVRRDEVAGIVRELRNTEKPDSGLVFRLVSGGYSEDGSISMETVKIDFNIYESKRLREEESDMAVRELLKRITETKIEFYRSKSGAVSEYRWNDDMETIPKKTRVLLLGFRNGGTNAVWQLSDGSLMYTSLNAGIGDKIDGLPQRGIPYEVAARYLWEPPKEKKS